MPFDRKRYPPDWKAISRARKEAAGWRCEWCRAPHGEVVTRVPGGFYAVLEGDEEDCTEEIVWRDKGGRETTVRTVAAALGVELDYGPEGQLLPDCRIWTAKVVLTVAHLGPNKHDKMDCSNLAALCQSCHLREDLADHVAHARQTRLRRKAVAPLFELEAA